MNCPTMALPKPMMTVIARAPRAAPGPTSRNARGRRVRMSTEKYEKPSGYEPDKEQRAHPLNDGDPGDVHHQGGADGDHQHTDAHQDDQQQHPRIAWAEPEPEAIGHAVDLVDHCVQGEDPRGAGQEQADEGDGNAAPPDGSDW